MYNKNMKNKTSINDISKIPKSAGVYFLKNKDSDVFYIGKARNLYNRINNHKKSKDSFKDIEIIHSVEWVKMANEIEALIKEREYIQHYQPKLNVNLRDDKQYIYVGITKEDYPHIYFTHQPLQPKRGNILSEYIGPFTDGKSIKNVLRLLRKSFPYYMTSQKRAAVKKKHSLLQCPYCHLQMCPGPSPNKTNYRRTISTIRKILKGNYKTVMKDIKKQQKEKIKQQKFEDAGILQKQYEALENVFTHRAQSATLPVITRKNNYSETANYLSKFLKTELPINIIEGYDISNIQGAESIASIVRFENGKPNKSLYRYMNIKSTDTPNDFLSLQEALRRRLSHTEWSYPDLILLDGGKGQLSSGVKELKKLNITIPIVSLAKKQEELFTTLHKNSTLLSSMPSHVEYLLESIRNEAHRFAITRHRARHRKVFKK